MAKKFLSPIDLAQNELQNAKVQNLASAPSSPVAGQIYYDTTLNQIGYYDGNTSAWVYPSAGSGTGSVTSVSVVSTNGFAGTVASSTTTPAITLQATPTGMLKSNGTAISAASSGTDYAPATSGSTALKGNGSGGFSSATLNDVGTATSDYSLGSNKITNLKDPTSAQDAATKNYVDTTSQGLDVKPSVVVVATSNVTASGTQTIDGVALTASQRVLLVGQTTASQNGIWLVNSSTWTRPTDFANGSTQVGTFVFVEDGTANSSSGWVLSGSAGVTVGTTSQTWVQFSGAGEITAGTGLSKSGNTLSVISSTAHKYAATIGNGSSTSISVTHSLGSQDVLSQVYDSSSYAVVECDIVNTSTSVTTFTFASAPASNAYRVVIIG